MSIRCLLSMAIPPMSLKPPPVSGARLYQRHDAAQRPDYPGQGVCHAQPEPLAGFWRRPCAVADRFSAQYARLHPGQYHSARCSARRSKQEIESADRTGVSYAMPAGDAEGDVTGGQWNQRTEAMRDAMDYFKNNPSVLLLRLRQYRHYRPQQQAMDDTLPL